MIHSKESGINPIQLLDKYYKDYAKLKEVLLAHGKSIYEMSKEISSLHPEYHINLPFMYEASYLHDIGIYKTNVNKIGCFGTEVYLMHGIIGGEIMRKEGYLDLAHACERHTGSGLDSNDLKKIGYEPPEKRIYIPQTIEEKLLCYCDKFFSKSDVTIKFTKQDILTKRSKYGDNVLQRMNDLFTLFK